MKKNILLILLCLTFVNMGVFSKTNLKLELLHEIDISTIYFPIGRLPLPVICGDMVYDNEIGIQNNYHKIYDLETGKLLKSYILPQSDDSYGLFTNGKQVVYVHEKDKKVMVYEGLEKVWEKEFNNYIYGLTMDDSHIYVAVDETGIVVMDINGNINDVISGDICEYITKKKYAIDILNDTESIYLNAKEYLFKIDKGTYEIKYKKTYEKPLPIIVLQNNKYLFMIDANRVDKETGEIIDSIEGYYFAVDEDFIIYDDGKKLGARRLDTGEILWEREYIENLAFEPLIDNGYFYTFLDKFYVLDVKTGEVVWEDEPIDYFYEYIPQIMATDEYVTVFVENRDYPKLRVYRKVYE